MVNPEPCKELERRSQLFPDGTALLTFIHLGFDCGSPGLLCFHPSVLAFQPLISCFRFEACREKREIKESVIWPKNAGLLPFVSEYVLLSSLTQSESTFLTFWLSLYGPPLAQGPKRVAFSCVLWTGFPCFGWTGYRMKDSSCARCY